MRRSFPRLLVLLIALLSFTVSFAQRKISGTVTDDKQAPLVGATVAVKGTKVATTTDAIGKFTLNVPTNGNTLVISYVGMQNREIAIGSSDIINAALTPTAGSMSDVVVVGYGRARKANLTVSQTGVSAKDIEKTINTTVEQAIQGRAAGVYVTQNSGQPGGGISVNIRGISSLTNTQPLYVIDGVQIQGSSDVSFGNQSTSNPLAGLNPSDIEDIQILQGPSATAIFGSRGTNGVILITTKRGKSGEIKINYAYQYNLQTPPKHLHVMNLREYAQMVNEYHALAGGTTPGEFLDPSILGEGTDWQKELFNNAGMSKHQLSLSGGSNNTTYYLSGEYLKQEGVAQGSGFDRYGVRVNLDNKPREWATIGVNLSFNQTNENLIATNYGDAASPLIANALRLTPQIPVKNLNGSWGGSDPVNGANQFAPINPIALANLITNKNMKRQGLGGINLGITPVKGLTIRSSLNGTIGNGLSTYYTPTYNIDQWHFNTVASLNTGTYTSWYWNWNELAEYTRQINRHNFMIMASHEAQGSEYQALSGGRTGFLTNNIMDVSVGDPTSATNGGGIYPWSMESYFGRLTYNFDNRYLLTSTYRRDGSKNFGPAKRWGTFPSVSAAWRVSREKFFNIPFISELKLRYETGLTGNQGADQGVYAQLQTDATPWGAGFLQGNIVLPDYRWEEQKTNNFGINLGFLKNRFTIEADYYIKNTSNLIMNGLTAWYQGTAGNGGLGAPLVNTGSLKTKGWNFTFISTNIEKKNFRWESNLNISHFQTIVTGLNSPTGAINRTSWWMNNWTNRSVIGYAPWLFYGYIQEGVFESVGEIGKSARPVDNTGNPRPIDANNGIWVGDAKYRDMLTIDSNGDGIPDKGDGKITAEDMTFIGNPWPKLTGGFTNSFSYKNFDVSILITGTYGNDVYNYIAQEASNPNNINLSRNLFIEAMNYAKLTTDNNGNVVLSNPGTMVPRMSTNPVSSENNFGKNTSRFVEDGSYLRLKNISLSYNVSSKYLNYTKLIKGLKATIGVQNLYTLTHYKGYDPEVGSYIGTGAGGGVNGGNQAIGIDFGRYPSTPMYSATINVNF
jgi:TonB-dependent starch-binding outer membrane protein SusC